MLLDTSFKDSKPSWGQQVDASHQLRSFSQTTRGLSLNYLSSPKLMPNRWSAVARGAALGMHVSNRTARRYYGTDCTTAFVTGKHPIKNLFYSPYTGQPLCDNYMTWYIKRVRSRTELTRPRNLCAILARFHPYA